MTPFPSPLHILVLSIAGLINNYKDVHNVMPAIILYLKIDLSLIEEFALVSATFRCNDGVIGSMQLAISYRELFRWLYYFIQF